MRPFKKRRRGGVAASFESGEAQLVANLTGQVVELLRDRHTAGESDPDPLAAELGLGGPSLPPEDPVLQRLLPDAYRDADDDASEFRRLTERSLTQGKVLNAEAVIESLVAGGMEPGLSAEEGPEVEVELDEQQVQAWLRTLTDVRLSLAVRLGIENEEDAMLVAESEDDATAAMYEIYDWLGYIQESLVACLD